jgi:FADH2 O2-dependent halogenase
MLYFAAASYTETVRRRGQNELAPGFLASRHPACAAAMAARVVDPAAVARAIAGINVAGLCDPQKQNWYPAEEPRENRGSGRVPPR